MQTLFEYLLFLAETITVVVAALIVLGFILSKAAQGNSGEKGRITIKLLNKHYRNLKQQLQKELLAKADLKKHKNKKEKKTKKEKKNTNVSPNLFILDFNGDMRASQVTALREEVTAIILTAKTEDEVCIRLESPGGMVPHYGLATSQLERLKKANLKITICVDKVAASGGYMMAVVGERILAAPFAIIGSIGVVAQLPNFNRFLDKNSIDYEQITAGQYKRTLTMFGQNTDEGREKMQDDINLTHDLFKNHITAHRTQVDIAKVATGEHWFATQAIELNLVDAIQTSDDYLMSQRKDKQLVLVKYKMKTPKLKQLTSQAASFILNSQPAQVLIKKLGW
jgi:serine protease SohB